MEGALKMSYKKAFKVGVFMKDYLEGKTTCDDLDLYVEQWAKQSGNISVYDFLGITEEQYAKWCENPDDLEAELKPMKTKNDQLVTATVSKRKIAKKLVIIAKEILKDK